MTNPHQRARHLRYISISRCRESSSTTTRRKREWRCRLRCEGRGSVIVTLTRVFVAPARLDPQYQHSSDSGYLMSRSHDGHSRALTFTVAPPLSAHRHLLNHQGGRVGAKVRCCSHRGAFGSAEPLTRQFPSCSPPVDTCLFSAGSDTNRPPSQTTREISGPTKRVHPSHTRLAVIVTREPSRAGCTSTTSVLLTLRDPPRCSMRRGVTTPTNS